VAVFLDTILLGSLQHFCAKYNVNGSNVRSWLKNRDLLYLSANRSAKTLHKGPKPKYLDIEALMEEIILSATHSADTVTTRIIMLG
jgi:hypothetical protein